MLVAPRDGCTWMRLLGLLVALVGVVALATPIRAQQVLFSFVQISDSQPNDAADQLVFEQVLTEVANAGQAGALLPRAVDFVVFPGDVVFSPDDELEWQTAVATLDTYLTANGIPYRAVPGNRDQDASGIAFYEQYIGDSGVWSAGSDDYVGHNTAVVNTGWSGLHFVGFNNSNGGANQISAGDLLDIDAAVTAAAANGENVFLVGHHDHDDEGLTPINSILETNGVIGSQRGHAGGTPFVRAGLSGVSNPDVWEFNSNAIVLTGAIIYFDVYQTSMDVYVIELLSNPTSLPAPFSIPLVFPLVPSSTPTTPIADFSATPTSGPAPLGVTFTDLSVGSPTSWLWDFGDTNTSTLQNPTHTYTTAGLYDVSLTATNANGSDVFTDVGLVDVTVPGQSLTLLPVADARVRSTSPGSNYGGSDHLRLKDAEYESYLRFDASSIGAQIPVSAALRLFVTNGGPDGGDVHSVAGTWTEAGITWSNAPGMGGAPLASAGAVSDDTWVEFDVSSVVTGAGSYDFGLTNDSTNSVYISSREGLDPPQLVVEFPVGNLPSVDFQGTPTQGPAPLLVDFQDLSTESPTSWLWEFGDGTTAPDQHPTHSYVAPGTYDVTLTATNALGGDSKLEAGYVVVTPSGSGTVVRDSIYCTAPQPCDTNGPDGTRSAEDAGGVLGSVLSAALVPGSSVALTQLDLVAGAVGPVGEDRPFYSQMTFSLLVWSDAVAAAASPLAGDLADVDVTSTLSITQDLGSYVEAGTARVVPTDLLSFDLLGAGAVCPASGCVVALVQRDSTAAGDLVVRDSTDAVLPTDVLFDDQGAGDLGLRSGIRIEVPEPGRLPMLLCGVALVAGLRRGRRTRGAAVTTS